MTFPAPMKAHSLTNLSRDVCYLPPELAANYLDLPPPQPVPSRQVPTALARSGSGLVRHYSLSF